MTTQLTGQEKAALLLTSLPAGTAQGVLARLGPQRSGLLRAQMERLAQTPHAELQKQVLREFHGLLLEQQPERTGADSRNAPNTSTSRGTLEAPSNPGLAANATADPARPALNRSDRQPTVTGATSTEATPRVQPYLRRQRNLSPVSPRMPATVPTPSTRYAWCPPNSLPALSTANNHGPWPSC